MSGAPERIHIFGDEIIALYKAGWGCQAIAKRIGFGHVTVWAYLKRRGIPVRPRGWKGNGKCVDCGKPTIGARRCRMHAKIRNAELNLEWRREHPPTLSRLKTHGFR